MTKKSPKGNHEPMTGNDFIKHAEERGAILTKHAGFVGIKTRSGKTYVTPGNKPLEKETRYNLKKWFKLLGLMIFILLCVYPIFIRLV